MSFEVTRNMKEPEQDCRSSSSASSLLSSSLPDGLLTNSVIGTVGISNKDFNASTLSVRKGMGPGEQMDQVTLNKKDETIKGTSNIQVMRDAWLGDQSEVDFDSTNQTKENLGFVRGYLMPSSGISSTYADVTKSVTQGLSALSVNPRTFSEGLIRCRTVNLEKPVIENSLNIQTASESK